MNLSILYALFSVFVISLVSLIGILPILFKWVNLDRILLMLVSLSAGSLLGGAFFHILPEVAEEGFGISISISVIGGMLLFFVMERFIHWRHCHHTVHDEHPHHLAIMNLVGDGVHNFLDGVIVAASYLASVPAGIATTVAVVLHEVPQEIGDFGVLIYSGISRWKALAYNFLSALLAVIGAIIGLIIGTKSEAFVSIILPFAAGGFIYIAASDLIPELHKECKCDDTTCSTQNRFLKDSLWYFLAMLVGIGLMYGLTLME